MTESTRIQERRQVAHFAKVRVEVTSGADQGLTLAIGEGPIRVGSGLENELVLSDDTVSRRHCEIERTPNGVRIRDAGSTNGVFAHGVRVLDAIFPTNVDLALGASVLRVTLLAESTDRELSNTERFGDLIGGSPRMRALFADLERIAPTNTPLLIEGETGTGKEVVAESVHRQSPRARGPFVVFDCGAAAPTLIESELFGHERGAFSGATSTHAGVFEQAHGGTIFLDELGELPLDLQPKLLRVLQKREVRRLGAERTRQLDVRLIAATNRNLSVEIQRKRFREDLYYRVAALRVQVPALRDRLEDLPKLVEFFLAQLAPPQTVASIPPDVWQMLRAHRWPGNVRELQNVLQRFLVTPERVFPAEPADSSTQTKPAPRTLKPLPVARREAAAAFERDYLQELMRQAGGKLGKAASLAEVSRQMVQKALRKHRFTAGQSSVDEEEAGEG